MKGFAVAGLIAAGALSLAGCTADWATKNSSPYIMEIAAINLLPTGPPLVPAAVVVNIFRKNNNGSLGTSPVEHIYLERYDVRYFRTDGRNVEGVDVPYRISGPLGNERFHTPGPGGGGEVQASVVMAIVRPQAALEPPLSNLNAGGGAIILTIVAEVTIHARTVQGDALEAKGQKEITF
jgi:hypothetical protein